MPKNLAFGALLVLSSLGYGSISEASDALSAGPLEGARLSVEVVMNGPSARMDYTVDPFTGKRSLYGFRGDCGAVGTIVNLAPRDAHLNISAFMLELFDEDPRYNIVLMEWLSNNRFLPSGAGRTLRLSSAGPGPASLVYTWQEASGLEISEENFEVFEEYIVRSCDLSRKTTIRYVVSFFSSRVDVVFEDGEEIVSGEMPRQLRITIKGQGD